MPRDPVVRSADSNGASQPLPRTHDNIQPRLDLISRRVLAATAESRMQRLVTAGLLPERAGQPVKAWVHMSLADLLLDGSSALQEEWTARVRAAWAAHRAEASAGGSDGSAWLDGDAAQAVACDAAMAPIVTGDVNPAALARVSGIS